MMQIIFRDRETGKVNYGVYGVSVIRHITPSEIGFTYASDGRISSCSFLATETIEIERIDRSSMIDQKRQEEIDSATKDKPVKLTDSETIELRMRNKNQFQMEVGQGKYQLRARPDSRAAKAHEMSQAGYTANDIAEALEIESDAVTRMLETTYV